MLQSSTVNALETIHQNMIVDEEMKDEDMFSFPNRTWAKNGYGE